MIKLDLRNNLAAQDMIRIIMKEKGLSKEEAVEFSISREMHDEILELGYASIALGLWGHDDPDRKWNKLDDAGVELKLDILKENLVENIAMKQKVNTETAICYFLIFTMDLLGYHI